MEEMERIRSDISQLTRRVDDFSLRLAVVEAEREGFLEKIDALKELMTEKMGGMQQSMHNTMGGMQRSIDGWNKIGFWLVTTVGGAVILGVLGLIFMRQSP